MRLKELRLQTNKTQHEIAHELNMPRTKYARYELNTAEPNIKTLIKLAQYFHTTIDNLVGNETPYLIDKSKFSDTQLRIIEEIQNLSDEACKRVESFITGFKTSEELKRN